jgi:hypothetical protein
MAEYNNHNDTHPMSESGGSSTPVAAAASDLDGYDTSDREDKIPTYVLGQKMPDYRTFGEPATHDDISSAGKFDAFVVKVEKPGQKNLLRSSRTSRLW